MTNPLLKFTGGIHIYGGDFFATQGSQWNAETLREAASGGTEIRRIFEAENKRLGVGPNTVRRLRALADVCLQAQLMVISGATVSFFHLQDRAP